MQGAVADFDEAMDFSLKYYDDGAVTDFGEANSLDICRVDGTLREVCCWRLLYVVAYIRDYAGRRPYHGDRGWEHHVGYWVGDWNEVPLVYRRYFGCGGCYHRVSFHVETWTWTVAEGWDWEDQV